MTPQKSDENGGEPRLEFTMQISTDNRRNLTASLVAKPLDAADQARLDAEMDRLLAQLARNAIMKERTTS